MQQVQGVSVPISVAKGSTGERTSDFFSVETALMSLCKRDYRYTETYILRYSVAVLNMKGGLCREYSRPQLLKCVQYFDF